MLKHWALILSVSSLFGHSMGGHMAIAGIYDNPNVRCAVAYDPVNLGAKGSGIFSDPVSAKIWKDYSDTLFMLNGWSGEKAQQEVLDHGAALDLVSRAPGLNNRPLMIIPADTQVIPMALHIDPLVEALSTPSGNRFAYKLIDDDHSFSASRLQTYRHHRGIFEYIMQIEDQIVDLRSDTLTQPCSAMRDAMMSAPLGDDVYGEDPTVIKLEQAMAATSGHQAGLFFPSGTQSNLVALIAHCQRGDEYIVGQNAHTYQYEGGGAAVLGSIQPQPIENADDGTIPLDKVRAAVKADDFHFAKTKLLALENTTGGKVISQDYIDQARQVAKEAGLIFHLDGARVFNAAVAQNLDVKEITNKFDSVSICMSKGLGAPIGSVLVGDEAFIDDARRWRKMVGGGMRQAGLLAAAALYALDNNVERLAEDHNNAKTLAEKLLNVEGLEVHGGSANTNMVYVSLREEGWQ